MWSTIVILFLVIFKLMFRFLVTHVLTVPSSLFPLIVPTVEFVVLFYFLFIWTRKNKINLLWLTCQNVATLAWKIAAAGLGQFFYCLVEATFETTFQVNLFYQIYFSDVQRTAGWVPHKLLSRPSRSPGHSRWDTLFQNILIFFKCFYFHFYFLFRIRSWLIVNIFVVVRSFNPSLQRLSKFERLFLKPCHLN